ncbi:MAG: outer membrane beta-barrel protein [Acidobacteriota bacterium]|nr:outer membrane beta-barrel protein [Acidobacteriota bacterium]
MARFRRRGTWVAVAILSMVCTLAHAEDIENRWRIGFAVGGFDTRDEVESNSANQLILTDVDDVPVIAWEDPRNDAAVFNALSIQPSPMINVSAQYAVSKIFVVEISAGYVETDVGDIEVQAQFFRDIFPDIERFNFRVFEINAGTVEMIPLRTTFYARFRPKANFNPYIGVGFGYTFIGFEPSDDFNDLSRNMDLSVGGFATLQTFPGTFNAPTSIGDLEGARVDARDAWEWHITGGLEYTVKRKWAVYFEITWSQLSRAMSIGFNGRTSLGVSVPQQREFLDTYTGSTTFGAVQVVAGGLIDGGRLVPLNPSDPPGICDTNPNACEFVPEPDGEVDLGLYYAQGGEFRYDNFQALIGFKHTF